MYFRILVLLFPYLFKNTWSIILKEEDNFQPCNYITDLKNDIYQIICDTQLINFEIPTIQSSNKPVNSVIINSPIESCTTEVFKNIKNVGTGLNITISQIFLSTQIKPECFQNLNGFNSLKLIAKDSEIFDIFDYLLYLPKVRNIHLENIKINRLPKRSFEKWKVGLVYLESLTLVNNGLKDIHINAFESQFSSLKTLIFRDQPSLNDLLKNSKQWSKFLPISLKEIGFFGCELKDQKATLEINEIISLKVLRIVDCRIREFSNRKDSLRIIINPNWLEELYLDLNEIDFQQKPLFEMYPKLKILSIKYNKGLIWNLGNLKLKRIDLTQNKIKSNSFPWKVQELVLSGSIIYDISSDILAELGIEKLILNDIPQLMSMKVDQKPGNWMNLFEKISPSLRILELSGAGLTDENLKKDFNFSKFNLLEELNLGSNNLKQFPGEILKQATNLQKFNLSRNQIKSFASENNTNNLPKPSRSFSGLTIVDLSNNKITDLPRCEIVTESGLFLNEFMNNFLIILKENPLPCSCNLFWLTRNSINRDFECISFNDTFVTVREFFAKKNQCNLIEVPCILQTTTSISDESISILDVHFTGYNKNTKLISFTIKSTPKKLLGAENDQIYKIIFKEIPNLLKKLENDHSRGKKLFFWRLNILSSKNDSKVQVSDVIFNSEGIFKGEFDLEPNLDKETIFVMLYKKSTRNNHQALKYWKVEEIYGEETSYSRKGYIGIIIIVTLVLIVIFIIVNTIWLTRKMKRQKQLLREINIKSNTENTVSSLVRDNCKCGNASCELCSEQVRRSLMSNKEEYSCLYSDPKQEYQPGTGLDYRNMDELPTKIKPGISNQISWTRRTMKILKGKRNVPEPLPEIEKISFPTFIISPKGDPLPDLPKPPVAQSEDSLYYREDSINSNDVNFYVSSTIPRNERKIL